MKSNKKIAHLKETLVFPSILRWVCGVTRVTWASKANWRRTRSGRWCRRWTASSTRTASTTSSPTRTTRCRWAPRRGRSAVARRAPSAAWRRRCRTGRRSTSPFRATSSKPPTPGVCAWSCRAFRSARAPSAATPSSSSKCSKARWIAALETLSRFRKLGPVNAPWNLI